MTATQEPTSPIHAAPHGGEVPAPIDPEHDIDPKSTILALVVTFGFVVASMWILYQIYVLAIARAEHEKIELVPPKELRALRSDEDYWLKKAMPVGESDKRPLSEINASIEEQTEAIIKAYLRR